MQREQQMQRCRGNEAHGKELSMSGPQQGWGRMGKTQWTVGYSAAFTEINQTG